MGRFFLLSVLIFGNLTVGAQDLCRVRKLTEMDIRSGVEYKYEYQEKGAYDYIQLILLKNGRYKYIFDSFARKNFSEGKWKIDKTGLVLNSDISRNDIPVKITYSHDTVNTINGFKLAIVSNKKGMLMTDAFININADSIKCLPMAGQCIGTYSSIDSVRVLFANGLSSKWLKVENLKDQNIFITIETEYLLSHYTTFDKFKCRMIKNVLRPLSGNWVH